MTMSQNEWVLEALRRGPLTPLDALQGCGCLRLAARVLDLRRAGHIITSKKISQNDKTFAQYTLAKEKQHGR
jgi:hypothetical protein